MVQKNQRKNEPKHGASAEPIEQRPPGQGDAAPGSADLLQQPGPGTRQSADDGYDEFIEVQQSVPREGMGARRHNRGSEEAMDADEDFDDVGSHRGPAGMPRPEGPDD